MQNFIDLYSTITDDNNEPLYGYIEFFQPDGTTPQNVLNKDNQNLGNVIITNQYGKISSTGEGTTVDQIFLQNEKDYKIVYWKYIGTQFDIHDPSQFSQVKTLDYYYTRISLKVDGLLSVGTIQDLRNFDTSSIEDGTVISLLGYYAPGDKAMVSYVWNSLSRMTDDGGAYIQPNGIFQGRFHLVNGNTVDVRDWGVFGKSLEEELDYNTGKLTAAITYANTYSAKIIFPNIYEGGTWYGFDGGNYRIGNCVVEDNVFFKAKPSTTCNFIASIFESSPASNLFVGVWNNVTVDKINSMNIATSNSGINNLKADTLNVYNDGTRIRGNINKLNFIQVKHDGDIYLDNVIIQSTHQIDCTCYITNTELKEIYFDANYDYSKLTIDNTTKIDIEQWPTTSKWWRVINKIKVDGNYGDLKGRTLDSTLQSYTRNFTCSNAIFDNFKPGANTSYKVNIKDCKGTINFNDAVNEITIEDCDITSTSNIAPINLYINNSNINGVVAAKVTSKSNNCTFEKSISAPYVTLKNCIVNGACTTLDTLTTDSTVFNQNVTYSGNITSYKSIYNSNLIWNIKATNHINFDYNKVNTSIQILNNNSIASNTATVDGSITNNECLNKNARLYTFTTSSTNAFKMNESEHDYIYADNIEYHNYDTDCSIGYNTADTDLTFTGKVLTGTQGYSTTSTVFSDWYFNTSKGIRADLFSFGRVLSNCSYLVECVIQPFAGSNYIVPIHESNIYLTKSTGTGGVSQYYEARNYNSFNYISNLPIYNVQDQPSNNAYKVFRFIPTSLYIMAKADNAQGMARYNGDTHLIEKLDNKNVKIYYKITRLK